MVRDCYRGRKEAHTDRLSGEVTLKRLVYGYSIDVGVIDEPWILLSSQLELAGEVNHDVQIIWFENNSE